MYIQVHLLISNFKKIIIINNCSYINSICTMTIIIMYYIDIHIDESAQWLKDKLGKSHRKRKYVKTMYYKKEEPKYLVNSSWQTMKQPDLEMDQWPEQIYLWWRHKTEAYALVVIQSFCVVVVC